MRGDARVLRAQVVPDDFHARYSAQWRAYRYIVIESMRPISPLLTKLAWSVPGTLDVAAMNRAGSAALGVHDFRAFCKRPSNKAPEDPLIRDILHLEWRRVEDPWGLLERGSALVLDIRAKSFCHNMVRCLTSAMVAIGQGKLPENEVAERLVSLDRYLLPGPAPAAGLALVGVGYPEFAGGPAGFLR
jgi:tRNA pseudouridine38-40 synthase